MKQSSKATNKDKINDLKIKGTLEQEYKTIKHLLVISVAAFILSCALEILFPILFSDATLQIVHQSYIINILLGVACSAMISLVCLWIPFRSKRDNQQAMLIRLVRNLFYDYIKLNNRIVVNSSRDENDNTYIGELSLIELVKKIESDSNKLVEEYNKSEVYSESIETIVNSVDTVFVPMNQMIRYFITFIMPEEYVENTENALLFNKNKCFSREKNVALYNQLCCSVEGIISFEDMCKLFSDYINPEVAPFEIIKRDIQNLSDSEQAANAYKRIWDIKDSLYTKLMNINNEFTDRELREKVSIWEKIKQLEEQIVLLTKDKQKRYNDMINIIYKDLGENSLESAKERIKELEEEFNKR